MVLQEEVCVGVPRERGRCESEAVVAHGDRKPLAMALISCSYHGSYLVAHVQGPQADHSMAEHIGQRGGLGHRHLLLLLSRLYVHPVHDEVRDGHLVGPSRLLDNLLGLCPLPVCQEPPHGLGHDEVKSRKS